MAKAKKQTPLIHRLSNRVSAQLYSIYLYALANKNNKKARQTAIHRARVTFIKHARLVLPIIYRTRIVPVLGRKTKPLTPKQIDAILKLDEFTKHFVTILDDSSQVDLEFVVFEVSTLLEASEEYWKSAVGLKRRIDMLGGHFHYSVINGALQAYGGNPEISGWRGIPGLTEHCEYCLKHIIGKFFRKGQFLPKLPAHHGCSCSWKLIKKE